LVPWLPPDLGAAFLLKLVPLPPPDLGSASLLKLVPLPPPDLGSASLLKLVPWLPPDLGAASLERTSATPISLAAMGIGLITMGRATVRAVISVRRNTRICIVTGGGGDGDGR